MVGVGTDIVSVSAVGDAEFVETDAVLVLVSLSVSVSIPSSELEVVDVAIGKEVWLDVDVSVGSSDVVVV